MATPQQAPLPKIVYGTFAGPIDQAAAQRISAGFAQVSANGVEELHLLFQTTGGYIGDGIFLYNLFKAFPIPLILYNSGSVQSIGVVAYMGAKTRKASAHATFMIHRGFHTSQAATAVRLKSVVESLNIDDARIEAVLKESAKIPAEVWAELDHQDFTFCAQDAVKFGVATEIGEFTPPPGAVLYNV